jgi:hypothetical protein
MSEGNKWRVFVASTLINWALRIVCRRNIPGVAMIAAGQLLMLEASMKGENYAPRNL